MSAGRQRASTARALTLTPGRAGDALAAAAIPSGRWGKSRLAALTGPERRFYRSILTSFRAGAPLTTHRLARAAAELGLEVESVLTRLAREDLVHLGRKAGTVRVAYPFSGHPTPHGVRFPDGREAFAMCAIDALGMAPMFSERIAIASQDPQTGDAISVELAPDGEGSWQPRETVVVSGTASGGESCDSCCPVRNFFASRENAERWLASQTAVEGTVISMEEAIVAGRTVFGHVLEGAEI